MIRNYGLTPCRVVFQFYMGAVLAHFDEAILLEISYHLTRCHWHLLFSFPYHICIIPRNDTYVNPRPHKKNMGSCKNVTYPLKDIYGNVTEEIVIKATFLL